PSKTDTVLSPELAVTMPTFPLKSPTATESGRVPTAKVPTGGPGSEKGSVVKSPWPLPSNTETLLLPALAVTIPTFPFNISTTPPAPERVPAPTETAPGGGREKVSVVNSPWPLPSNTDTVLLPELAVTMPTFPLKFPTATESGPVPTEKAPAGSGEKGSGVK